MNSVTADSFVYRSKFQPSKKPLRKRSNPTSRPKAETSPTIGDEKVAISYSLDILQVYRVYVDKKLNDHKYYEQLSLALGATVVQDPKDGISVLVSGPKEKGRLSKLATTAMENHVYVVSPFWLKECYVTRQIHSPHLYPCDFVEAKKKLMIERQQASLLEDDNPFGIELNDMPEQNNQTQTSSLNQQEDQSPQLEQENRAEEQGGEEEVVVFETDVETDNRRESLISISSSSDSRRETRASSSRIVEQEHAAEIVINNTAVKELLNKKRKEQAEREKQKTKQGNSKKQKKSKDGSLNSFFGQTNKISLWYGESSKKHFPRE